MLLVDKVIKMGFEVVVISFDDFTIHLSKKLCNLKKVSEEEWEVNGLLKADEKKILYLLKELKLKSIVDDLENTLTKLLV